LKPRLFIVTFSELARDGRVLRQVRSLAPHFEVTVAALGEDPAGQLKDVPYHFVKLTRKRTLPEKVLRMLSYLPGAAIPSADAWPWSMTSEYRGAKKALFAGKFDLLLCNDLNTVLLGVEAKRKAGLLFVADYHEFPGREATERLSYRIFKGPHALRSLRRYGKLASATLTVNQDFVDSFRKDHGIEASVVLNAPSLRTEEEVPARREGPLRLVHHGLGSPNRNIDVMIDAVSLAKRDAVLHLMLVGDAKALAGIRAYAETRAPGRVIFEQPVDPDGIVDAIRRFDVGIIILQPHSFNNECALPNKLFEYLHAGLAVIYSKVSALVDFQAAHHNGWISETITGQALADVIDSIEPGDLAQKREASWNARVHYQAQSETDVMVKICTGLCPDGGDAKRG
jgi:glycosyltransferase involved in cell wall biosynthesis